MPSSRLGKTKIITNDLGHIIIEGKRSSSSPWGSFIGTWQAEKPPLKLKTRSKLQKHISRFHYVDIPDVNKLPTSDDRAGSVSIDLPSNRSERPPSDASSLRVETAEEPPIQSPPFSRPESRLESRAESVSLLHPKSVNELQDSRINSAASYASSRPESGSKMQSPLQSQPLSTKS